MMKKIFLAIAAIVITGLSVGAQTPDEVEIVTSDNVQLEVITPAQPVEETKQEIKEREKRLRELEDDMAHAKAFNSLHRGYFVLLAEDIRIGNMGYRHFDINSNSNFILVQGDDAIIQFALNTGSPGVNGLGGWTGKGKVHNKRITEKKNGDLYMQFSVVSGQICAGVSITLYNKSNRAEAYISGGPSITINGSVLPYRDKNHR